MSGLSAAFTTDFLILFVAVAVVLILFGMVINLYSELSSIKTRYKRMMGTSAGDSIEQMLASHTSTVNRVADEQRALEKRISTLEELMRFSVRRVAVIHFDAFEQTGQNLSWCVAMLDGDNNGVVFSLICGQETERSYSKPVESGRAASGYKLTQEEERTLRQAMGR